MFNLLGENIKIIELLLFTMPEPFLIQKMTKFNARLRHNMKKSLFFLTPFLTIQSFHYFAKLKTVESKSSNR